MFVFSSDMDTKHAQDALINSYVAGSVVLETKIVGKIQGIQFNGNMYVPENELMTKAKKRYMKKYPFARLMETTLWVLKLHFIKLTDNRLSFGKKMIWRNSSSKV